MDTIEILLDLSDMGSFWVYPWRLRPLSCVLSEESLQIFSSPCRLSTIFRRRAGLGSHQRYQLKEYTALDRRRKGFQKFQVENWFCFRSHGKRPGQKAWACLSAHGVVLGVVTGWCSPRRIVWDTDVKCSWANWVPKSLHFSRVDIRSWDP